MALRCSRFISRTTLSSIKSAAKSSSRTASAPAGGSATSSSKFSIPTRSASSPLGRFSRCPSELGCVQSLLPLHSAVATATMTSRLSMSSCRALSQGTLCRTSPDL